MERFVHFLIVEPDVSKHSALRKQLSLAGSILLFAENLDEAKWELSRKEIGIVMLPPITLNSKKTIKKLQQYDKGKRAFFLALINEENHTLDVHKYLKEGFTDFLYLGLDSNTLKAKLRVFKSLFQKDQRIGHLLSNIFPNQVLADLNNFGKYSPKRVENGVVMFTDFVNFSEKSLSLQPIEIVRQLESYFSKFDEISKRYRLEKIKTIGDAYMTLAGVTESHSEPILRSCLAAIEIREWVANEAALARTLNQEPWEIRIGIHSGPLVAGILGSDKMSFDVWGDTVNLAARAQEVSWPGQITISQVIAEKINTYFHLENRGLIQIKNRSTDEQMYFLENLKSEFSLYEEGLSPSPFLREKCGLPRMDFNSMRTDLLNQLKKNLPENLTYHDINHTLGVEKSAKRLAKLEGLNEDEELILLTAVLYHDAGFIHQYNDNELLAIKMIKANLPKFGYDDDQINTIAQIIASTRTSSKVVTLLEKIMSDADHDYFGRAEYYSIAEMLREELALHQNSFTEDEWLQFQINYLENKHLYYTASSISIRLPAKKKRINELKRKWYSIQPTNKD
ncbi:MAG: HD domain-containing protein [Bacteroidetes bacterium]|nr:HD domain-containing protein [Bacteroidota bacterium]